jgi:hypothetical protein
MWLLSLSRHCAGSMRALRECIDAHQPSELLRYEVRGAQSARVVDAVLQPLTLRECA